MEKKTESKILKEKNRTTATIQQILEDVDDIKLFILFLLENREKPYYYSINIPLNLLNAKYTVYSIANKSIKHKAVTRQSLNKYFMISWLHGY